MTDACKFCEIITRKLPANIIFEDDHFIAFLDIRPLFPGHTLVVPKVHYVTLYDAPDALVKDLFVHTKKIGKAIQKALAAEGSFIALNNIVSQSVPHLHVHIVPRNKGDGLKGFFWPRTLYTDEAQKQAVQIQIIQELTALHS